MYIKIACGLFVLCCICVPVVIRCWLLDYFVLNLIIGLLGVWLLWLLVCVGVAFSLDFDAIMLLLLFELLVKLLI